MTEVDVLEANRRVNISIPGHLGCALSDEVKQLEPTGEGSI
jgi:hypothetical protein